MRIRDMHPADQNWVLEIYQKGIETGQATFESAAPDWDVFDKSRRPSPRLVIEHDHLVVGWAALSPVSSRAVYAGVAEVMIYIDPALKGQSLGYQLLTALIEASEREGIWTLQAVIFPENESSVALHEKCGFKRVGLRSRIGLMSHGPKAGQWRDTVLMERRSQVCGV